MSEFSRPEDLIEEVNEYYDTLTEGFYMTKWSRDHLHLGVFEPGECPNPEDYPDGVYLSSKGLDRACKRLVELTTAPANIQSHYHVVDAGSGVGGPAILVAKLHNCRVTGLNINQLHLDISAEKARNAGLSERVQFQYADVTKSLPFEDNSIDAVMNIESACHYEDRNSFLREVYRILKPGGRIAAVDWMSCDPISPDEYKKYIQPICDTWAFKDLENQSSYIQKLQAAGFEVLEFEGFGDKVMDNLKIFEHDYRTFLNIYFSGATSPKYLYFLASVGALYHAWRDGFYDLRRYCAKKPDGSA